MKETIISICIVVFLVILCVAACSAGGGSDGTAENWILAIILLLAWLKGK